MGADEGATERGGDQGKIGAQATREGGHVVVAAAAVSGGGVAEVAAAAVADHEEQASDEDEGAARAFAILDAGVAHTALLLRLGGDEVVADGGKDVGDEGRTDDVEHLGAVGGAGAPGHDREEGDVRDGVERVVAQPVRGLGGEVVTRGGAFAEGEDEAVLLGDEGGVGVGVGLLVVKLLADELADTLDGAVDVEAVQHHAHLGDEDVGSQRAGVAALVGVVEILDEGADVLQRVAGERGAKLAEEQLSTVGLLIIIVIATPKAAESTKSDADGFSGGVDDGGDDQAEHEDDFDEKRRTTLVNQRSN